MSKNINVGGDIIYKTAEDYMMHAQEGIKNNSQGLIAQNGGKGGIKFKKPQPTPQFEEIYSLAIDLAWISMVVMYLDGEIEKGSTHQRTAKAHKFTILDLFQDKSNGFRCYIFKFKISQKDFHAIVFVGTRDKNFYSVTDNLSQFFRISQQVDWARKIGENTKNLENVIFAGHSKGGREAAQAAIAHGSATVYSYNTSIAYFDDWWGKIKEYISNGGVMHHFTTAGELLMMMGWNGENAGFKPTIVFGDDVKLRDIMVRGYNPYTNKHTEVVRTSYYCRPDEKGIDVKQQTARHSDYNLMLKGLENATIMSPSTMRYFR